MLTVAHSVCLGGSTSEVILCHQLVGLSLGGLIHIRGEEVGIFVTGIV